jgi:phosphoglucomutase
MLVSIPELISDYYSKHPDMDDVAHQVVFGTSGHRGISHEKTFNEDHVMAITQAICHYRAHQGINGPLFLGKDTHALSEPAFATALEVLAANEVTAMIQRGRGYTPTPVVSHAILTYNHGRDHDLADGIVITPSHNPPDSGGFKYNPPEGGPADTDTTAWIADAANALLADSNRGVTRVPYEQALRADSTHHYDYVEPYVNDLQNMLNLEAVRSAGLRMAADAMGGSGLAFWEPIAERYGLHIDVLHGNADPTFSFMTVDRDGKVRMDCSSPYAMAGLIALKDHYDIAFGNDPDFDRHGIVTRSAGLLNPNHYLCVAIWYLFQNRPGWDPGAAVGKTLVSTSMIDRIARHLHKPLLEVPVGFKWFVDGLLVGSCAFGGEESAGAAFLRTNGTVWTTDKDGLIMNLLAAEIMATTERDPGEHYRDLQAMFGSSVYERIDAKATPEQKAVLKQLSPGQVRASTLAGEPILATLTLAPGNRAPIGGLKVVTESGWFAARPSGTEDVYKVYAESFRGTPHLRRIQEEAQTLITAVFKDAGV